jgi:hypothetical protein
MARPGAEPEAARYWRLDELRSKRSATLISSMFDRWSAMSCDRRKRS